MTAAHSLQLVDVCGGKLADWFLAYFTLGG